MSDVDARRLMPDNLVFTIFRSMFAHFSDTFHALSKPVSPRNLAGTLIRNRLNIRRVKGAGQLSDGFFCTYRRETFPFLATSNPTFTDTERHVKVLVTSLH